MSNVRILVKVTLVTQPLSVLQTLRTVRRNVLETLPQLSVEQPMVSANIAKVSWHMVNDTQALRRVMANNVTNYPKPVVMNNVLTLGLGHYLFTAEGKNWRWQRRRIFPPEFTASAYRAYSNSHLAPFLQRHAKCDPPYAFQA